MTQRKSLRVQLSNPLRSSSLAKISSENIYINYDL